MECFLSFHSFSGITENNLQTLGKKCHFTETLFQDIVIIYCLLKDLTVRKEHNCGSCLTRITYSDFFQRIHCLSAFISLFINFTFTADGDFQPGRQCIYNRSAYSMETTGYFVSSTAEFTAGMKNGKNNFNCRDSCFMIDTYRNTTSVIDNCNGIIRIDHNLNFRTKSSKCFINRIVYDLINQMMKTSAGCTSDIHTRSLSYGFQTFQNLDLIRSVFCIFSTHFIPPVNI